MANTNAPFGFSQRSGNGSSPTYEMVERKAQYNAGAIYSGDPVTSQTDGTIAQASAGTTQIAGIFDSCKYLSVSQKRTIWSNYWPGSDVASGNYVTCYIVNDPNARFTVQAGGSTTAIGLADIDANINFGIGTGNAANGISGAYADQTTIGTTSTLPFRIVGLVTDPPGSTGTDTTSGYNWIVVGFNNVDTKSLTGIA
jgi:hypothetical protein